ncbi:ATP-dependent DNA helicase PIF1-like [Mya arenaria]|uniref:ATP-dependent DNA helicase PIF1-like n=1 Tax=Mya arenaria TaxID=6604 RepID=UPI0022DEBB10|nr:ATP-dependent DNA helicase PIF1-like [Mya arenaria]
MALSSISCTGIYEELNTKGETLRKMQHKNVTLSLGRNEFKDVILCINFPSKREMKYTLREMQIHKKFAKDGKATIKLPNESAQVMISNCAPDQLIMFLKTMTTKLECLRKKGFVSDRLKWKSDLPRTFDEISPLTLRDLKEANEVKVKAAERLEDFTPKGKRKRMASDEKENMQPTGAKMARKLITTTDEKGAIGLRDSSRLLAAIENPVKLNKEQNAVLEAVRSGRNIFFTGSAGTGKSFLLRRIIGALAPQHTFPTASTGVAACHIGGTTLHQFAGVGSGQGSLEQCIELASRTQIAQQWRKCHHLIIDEISMVDGDFFDKLETVGRVIRKSDKPFGGIQLIICGDFLQLPPVTKGEERRKFCFQSKAWRKCIDMNMELTDVRRQSDKTFISVLQNIRMGRCPEFVYTTLRGTAQNNIQQNGILATQLCTHKEDVNQINNFQLKKLTGPSKSYEATDSDEVYLKQINFLSPVPATLTLTVGAQVMLAKNVDITKGLVNGARGVVIGFETGSECNPIVKFLCGLETAVKPTRWTFKVSGGVLLTRKQIPLKLAWAISIHKSQGMTLDCVEISLSKVFESGQSYVALSRAKSLEGLRVLDFDRKCVRADPEVLKFYHKMGLKQKMLSGTIELESDIKRPKHW